MIIYNFFFGLSVELYLVNSLFFLVLLSSLIVNNGKYLLHLLLTVLFTAIILVLLFPAGDMFGFDFLVRFSDVVNNIRFLMLFISILILLTFRNYLAKYLASEGLLVLILSIIGMLLALLAYDFRLLFIGLELMGISFYILIALDKNISTSIKAGLNYYVIGSAMTALNLLGIIMVYKVTGTFNWLNLSQMALFLEDSLTLNLGMVLILISLLFKLAAAPFHYWAPRIYKDSTLFMVVFQGLLPKMPLLFITYSLINIVWQPVELTVYFLLAITVCLSVLVGSIGLLFQNNFKTIFVYSSIANIGLALSAISDVSETNLQSLGFFISIYVIMSTAFAALFFSVGSNNNLTSLKGLIRLNPYLAIAAAIILFSLAGIPPLAGFYSKFVIMYNVIYNENYMLVLPLIIGSCISCFYYLYLVKTCIFDSVEAPFLVTFYKCFGVFLTTGIVLLVSTNPWLVILINGSIFGQLVSNYV